MPAATVTLPVAVLVSMTSMVGHGLLLAGRYRLDKLVGAGLVMAAALIAVDLGGWQAVLTGGVPPRSGTVSPAPAAPTVLVNSAGLVGHRAQAVLASMRRHGLQARLVWVPTSGRPVGTVLSVQPSGALRPGTIVTVTAAARPAQQGDGNSGDGGGNNGGNGGEGGGNDGGGGNGDWAPAPLPDT